jgi:protein gp37
MGAGTKIEWAHHTFNPWIGCSRVSPACDNCYTAVSTTARAFGVRWGPGEPRRPTGDLTWVQPLAWNRKAARDGVRYRVFCASLADVFDNEVSWAWRERLWKLILDTPNLDWLILTKRIGNVAGRTPLAGLPANGWLGITVANQTEAARDIPKLLGTNVSKRFLSIEPMLGPIDLDAIDWDVAGYRMKGVLRLPKEPDDFVYWSHECWGIDWVICGGESGTGARPMHPDWARSLRDQCAAAAVPFLFKQWGQFLPWSQIPGGPDAKWFGADRQGWSYLIGNEAVLNVGKKVAGRLLDGVQHDAVPA